MTLIQIAEDFLEMVSSELDPFTSQQGRIQTEGNNKVTLFTPSHIQFAKYGRGPGKNPPLDPIIDWIKEKGIVTDKDEVIGTAFAIQKSIAANGTLTWVPNAPNAMDEAIDNNLDDFNKELSNLIAKETSEQFNEALLKVFPPRVEFKI